MSIEHFIYSAALAVLIGMVFYTYTGRDSSWIIILFALAPDLDVIANPVLRIFGIRLLFEEHAITHGTFHNVLVMVLFGIAMAFLLHPLGIKFFDALFFSTLGFGAHLFEDALVYNPGYKFLWPFYSKTIGLGLLPDMLSEEYYVRDFFHIANTEILIIGLLLLLVAVIIRTWYERSSSWLRWYMPEKLYFSLFGKKSGAPER